MLLAVSLAVTGWGGRCSDVEPEEIGIAWQDEFDGPAGQSPSPSRWKFDIGTDWGNAQLEYDTDRPENVSLDGNGNLAITALKENYQGRQYTSGRITTEQRFSQAYGRFEARIKLPVGQGIWPAFWLLGSDFRDVGWPDCGEIDILEYRGQEPNVVQGAVHGPGYSGGEAIWRRYTLGGSEGFNAEFHVFALEWSPNSMTWLVDEIPYFTVTPGDLPSGTTWVFDHSFFIILNVAVGGNFVGPPDASTSFPQTMLIDYVRVYEGGF
jgi:beta-glucanase (GH16 family)